jgi:hypothetical protein
MCLCDKHTQTESRTRNYLPTNKFVLQHWSLHKTIDRPQKVATRCYKTFEDVMFGKAKKAHIKKYGSFESLEGKTNGTGIRFIFIFRTLGNFYLVNKNINV